MPADGDRAESELVELMARAIDLRERGMEIDAAMLCADRQDLVDHLRDALAAHERLATTLAGSGTRDDATDPMRGRVLGERYEIVRRVGMGAMGSVFAARDRALQRFVALKIVEPWVLDDAERRARFRREAQAIAALHHASIVAVHDHGEGELPFLAMDLVPGLDLEAVLDRSLDDAHGALARGEAILAAFERAAQREVAAIPPLFTAAELAPDPRAWLLPWPMLAARIVLALARALAHAHRQHVLHRDVKPSNVRLRPDGGIVLLDFGLARLPGTGSLTREGTLIGTLAYMAPEQVRGDRAATSPSVDVYGLGATLYRLLTLRPPFLGEPAVLMKHILVDDATPVRRLAPEVPRDLAAICQRAIEKRQTDRYVSAAAMAADLEAFLEYRPVLAAPPSVAGRAWRRMRRYPARTVAVALIGVVLPLAILAKQGSDARGAERMRLRAHTARAGVPALVTLEGRNPAMSVTALRLPNPDPRGFALARLDHVLAADPEDIETLVLRAMLHLDCARIDQGLADLRRLQDGHARSAVLSAVLERLSASEPLQSADWRTHLAEGLPGVETAFDGFLSGYLKLRGVRYRDGLADIETALERDGEFVPALHLLPLALLAVGERTAAMDAAIRVEGVIGQPTARTQHVIGRERHERGRVREAVAAFEQSLALCPDQHGPLQNVIACLLDLGEIERANEAADRALAIRPDAVSTWRSKLQISGLLEQTDELADLVARVETVAGRPWWLELELGEIALRGAFRAARVADDGERLRLCREAEARLSQALSSLPFAGADLEKVQTHLVIAARLAEGKAEAAAEQLLLAMAGGRKEPTTISDAAALLAAADKVDFALYLLCDAHASSPDHPRIGSDLIDLLLRRGNPGALAQAAAVWHTCLGHRHGPLAARQRARILHAVDLLGEEGLVRRCRALLDVEQPNHAPPDVAGRAHDARDPATAPPVKPPR